MEHLLDKKLIIIREILELINPNSGGLQNYFSIKKKYIDTLLRAKLKLGEDDSDIICNYFFSEGDNDRIDLRKLFLFDPSNLRNKQIILSDEIIPKIKYHIINYGNNNNIYHNFYKEYKNKLLISNNNKDHLDKDYICYKPYNCFF